LRAAIRAQVTSRAKVGQGSDWIRFDISVASVYKRPDSVDGRPSTAAFQPASVVVPAGDLACRCPKLRRRRTYLLVGRTATADAPPSDAGGGPVLVVDRDGVAMRWNDAASRRIRRFARSQRC